MRELGDAEKMHQAYEDVKMGREGTKDTVELEFVKTHSELLMQTLEDVL